ncbi:MAG: hypothetical protein AAB353_10180 [Candidatus Hydrogenedentota bacterium]
MPNRSDEIIDEIHRIREEHAAAFDHDIERIAADIQRQERESGKEYVTRPPRRPKSYRPPSDSTTV